MIPVFDGRSWEGLLKTPGDFAVCNLHSVPHSPQHYKVSWSGRGHQMYCKRGVIYTFIPEAFEIEGWPPMEEWAWKEIGAPVVKPELPPKKMQKVDVAGTSFVYFVLAQDVGLIKIGFTRSVPDRVAALQCQSPIPLVLLGYIPNVSMKKEGELHVKFKNIWVRGEWFRNDPSLLEFIAKEAVNV